MHAACMLVWADGWVWMDGRTGLHFVVCIGGCQAPPCMYTFLPRRTALLTRFAPGLLLLHACVTSMMSGGVLLNVLACAVCTVLTGCMHCCLHLPLHVLCLCVTMLRPSYAVIVPSNAFGPSPVEHVRDVLLKQQQHTNRSGCKQRFITTGLLARCPSIPFGNLSYLTLSICMCPSTASTSTFCQLLQSCVPVFLTWEGGCLAGWWLSLTLVWDCRHSVCLLAAAAVRV